eukprot:gnl/MRDRNA2_/MRDRNA2_22935_c0_seq1.p1 gnl/MRDRNA2_/MRDRNA2_22935_c0~~gnl/MRDRNA2_/MRDRNA2_22935_c0_seq1.p1  ORF type:complete len:229 (+),score=44.83 gnl/MRDRNA2_/MRDRNA2_22935_c0_seq1:79-765(+)
MDGAHMLIPARAKDVCRRIEQAVAAKGFTSRAEIQTLRAQSLLIEAASTGDENVVLFGCHVAEAAGVQPIQVAHERARASRIRALESSRVPLRSGTVHTLGVLERACRKAESAGLEKAPSHLEYLRSFVSQVAEDRAAKLTLREVPAVAVAATDLHTAAAGNRMAKDLKKQSIEKVEEGLLSRSHVVKTASMNTEDAAREAAYLWAQHLTLKELSVDPTIRSRRPHEW